MGKPLLTVCIITYNHNEYIKQALDSILAQELSVDWKIVVADDKSTDGTREILLEYQKMHPKRIELVLQKRNVGPEQNWLDLLSRAKSKYVLYAEGDDYFTDRRKLQTQVDFLEANLEYALCFHPVQVVYEDGSMPNEIFPSFEHNHNIKLSFNELLANNFMQTNSVMYRWRFEKEDILKIFPRNIAPGDWMLHILHAQKGKIGLIDKTMAVYRRHASGVMWDSHAGLDNLWSKRGIEYLGLFWETFKLCEGITTSKDVVLRQIYDMFERFIDLDKRKGTQLLAKAVQLYPDSANYYLLYLHRAAHYGIGARKEIGTLRAQLKAEQGHSKQLSSELSDIKHSRVWKARNQAVKIVGKKPIQ